MKIGIISTFVGQKTAGAEISTLLLTKLLAEKNDVFIITTKVKEEMPCRAYDLSVSLVPNIVLMIGTKVSNWWMEYKIKKILRQEKPDVIHIQDFSIMPPAVSAAKELKIPIVMTVRDFRHRCNLSTCFENGDLHDSCCKSRKGYLRCLEETLKDRRIMPGLARILFGIFYSQRELFIRMLSKIDAFIAVSDFVKKELINSRVDKNKISKILVPPPVWKSISKKKKKNVFIFAPGLLVKGKGFENIIKSFARIKGENVILRIAGDGAARKQLEELCKRLNCENRVLFLGKMSYEAMRQEYGNVDVVVQGSVIPESLSRIILEAFKMKKPIIAANVGGNSELVKPGRTGLLLNSPNNITLLERYMRQLVKNEKLRKKLGEAGYRLLREKAMPERIVKEHVEVYKKVMSDV